MNGWPDWALLTFVVAVPILVTCAFVAFLIWFDRAVVMRNPEFWLRPLPRPWNVIVLVGFAASGAWACGLAIRSIMYFAGVWR